MPTKTKYSDLPPEEKKMVIRKSTEYQKERKYWRDYYAKNKKKIKEQHRKYRERLGPEKCKQMDRKSWDKLNERRRRAREIFKNATWEIPT